MYCSQCGKKIANTSKFCSGCGSPIVEEEAVFSEEQEELYDPVKDIKQKLKEIDSRKKPPQKKKTLKNVINVFKGEESVFELLFEDDFEEQKLSDKKHVILGFQIPDSMDDLEKFAKYIDSQIQKKDELTPAWKEKLKQVYDCSKFKAKESKTHKKIKEYYKAEKRKELRYEFRGLVWLLLIPLILAFGFSFIYHYVWLTVVSGIATFFWLILTLYMYDLI